MQPLWAPWRSEYISRKKEDKCVFCIADISVSDDEKYLILYRGTNTFVMMNKFPYTNGHVLIAPLRHINEFELLTDEESYELMFLLKQCTRIIREKFCPQGVNIGLNLGEAAGAGICEHLHFHALPRWVGDSSFMAVLSETKIISEHITSTYNKLKPLFSKISL